MDKIKITKRQKKMLMIAGVVGLAFLIFIVFIYLPSRGQLIKMKNEFQSIETELDNIKRAAGEGKSLEENIGMLKAKLDALNKKFPDKEEMILRDLSDAAARYDIHITALKPQKKKAIKEIGGIAVKVRDSYIEEMPIALSLKASYKTLGQFFRSLKEEVQVFVRVDSVRMSKGADKASADLDVELNLNAYLVSGGS